MQVGLVILLACRKRRTIGDCCKGVVPALRLYKDVVEVYLYAVFNLATLGVAVALVGSA